MTSSIWLRSERSDSPWLRLASFIPTPILGLAWVQFGVIMIPTLLTATSVFIIAFICRNAGHVLGRYRMVHVVVPVPSSQRIMCSIYGSQAPSKVGLSAWMYPVADTLVAVKWIYLPGVISFVNFNWQVPYAFSVRWLALWSTTIPFARCIQSQLVAAFTIHVTALILLKGRLDLAWRHIHPRDY